MDLNLAWITHFHGLLIFWGDGHDLAYFVNDQSKISSARTFDRSTRNPYFDFWISGRGHGRGRGRSQSRGDSRDQAPKKPFRAKEAGSQTKVVLNPTRRDHKHMYQYKLSYSHVNQHVSDNTTLRSLLFAGTNFSELGMQRIWRVLILAF